MYKETDAVTAFMQYKMGGKGYILHDNARFIVDFPDEKPEPETAVVVPKAETPENGPVHRKRGKPTEAEKKNIEQRILAAWNRGERNVGEIVRITGYDYRTVVKYIPDEGERP